jgi:hypothetical protein
MGTSAIVFLIFLTSGFGAVTPKPVVEKQNRVFGQYWGTDFEWKFEALPTSGTVPNFRVPYSGYIYPDRAGGTADVLRKYDSAFHGGRSLAVAFEKWDTTAFKKPTPRKGPLGMTWGTKMETPNWHGHCNGWTAAAIRHAEPKTAVRRNGVVFTPADIKALLAEIYIYNDVDMLAGIDSKIDAGLFHAIITNWLGRGGHPLGMEADPGEEKWNYPTYAFSSSSAMRSERRVEVKLNLAYVKDTNGEYQESPRIRRVKSFHYDLFLNSAGEIIGGNFYGDSEIIDMLWLPLRPKQGRQTGNEMGNPHVDVNQVLAIWRESAAPEERQKWLIADPAREDRIFDVADVKTLIPLQDPHAPRSAPPVATMPSPTRSVERTARAGSTPRGDATVGIAEALDVEWLTSPETPSASAAAAGSVRVSAATPLMVDATADESAALRDIFSTVERNRRSLEPATVTDLSQSPVTSVELNIRDVPNLDAEPVEMADESLLRAE